jgi:hypothetical protein
LLLGDVGRFEFEFDSIVGKSAPISGDLSKFFAMVGTLVRRIARRNLTPLTYPIAGRNLARSRSVTRTQLRDETSVQDLAGLYPIIAVQNILRNDFLRDGIPDAIRQG